MRYEGKAFFYEALKMSGIFLLFISVSAMLSVRLTPDEAMCVNAYKYDATQIEWSFSHGCWTSIDGITWVKHGTSPWENIKSMWGMQQVPSGTEVVR
jgi:hypothetical protein